MGMSANACLAWGVDLKDEYDEMDYEVREKIEEILDWDWDLTSFFGLGEPPYMADGFDSLPQEERTALREAWDERERTEVPVSFESYGHCDYAVKCLVVKRTYHRVNWGCEEIDPGKLAWSLQPPIPDGAETAAIEKVLDAIGFKGDREPKLLLFAYYG